MRNDIKNLIHSTTPDNFKDNAMKLRLLIIKHNLALSEIKEIQEYIKAII